MESASRALGQVESAIKMICPRRTDNNPLAITINEKQHINDKTKEALVQSGRENTLSYFKWYDDPKNGVVNRPSD